VIFAIHAAASRFLLEEASGSPQRLMGAKACGLRGAAKRRRHVLRPPFVSWKDRKLIMPDLKAIYRAETAEAAAAELIRQSAKPGDRFLDTLSLIDDQLT
jgi:hypothetical protein